MGARLRIELLDKQSKSLDSPLHPKYGGGYEYDKQSRKYIPIADETFMLELARNEVNFLLRNAPAGDIYGYIPLVAQSLATEGKVQANFAADVQNRYEQYVQERNSVTKITPSLPQRE